MYQFIKPLLFLISPEKAHFLTLKLFELGLKLPLINTLINKQLLNDNQTNKFEFCGISFPNKIGLAAGFDKNASYIPLMEKLGFGFIEIGTVTLLPQKGNPKPRLFRLKKDESLINRMGFNNGGIEEVVKNLKKQNSNVVIGGNIGKNKNTANDLAFTDYEKCFNALYPFVDYFVINVSSPNTPNLRNLQDKEPLKKIINQLYALNNSKRFAKPILLKIAPDLNEDQLNDIVEVAESTELQGLIATNTTISRKNLSLTKREIDKIGNGGLSGKAITQMSNSVVLYLKSRLPEDFPVIGVGGIYDKATARERFESGADLIQIYSGLIFKGPDLVKELLEIDY